MSFSVLLLAAAAALPVPEATSGPVAADSSCSAAPFRAFDFWAGAWVVRDSAGREIGRNRIRRVAGGCALLESWTSARGSTGTSLNFYDPESGRWTQVWVGESGVRLRLAGGRRGDSMVLQGTRARGDTIVRDRITWTPRDDGTVEQRWETSGDGGTSWEVSWRGVYHRISAGGEDRSPTPRWAAGGPDSITPPPLRIPRRPRPGSSSPGRPAPPSPSDGSVP